MKTIKTSWIPKLLSAPTRLRPYADVNDVVRYAARGDRMAVAVIASRFGETLLHEAMSVLGSDFEEDARDVVQDFLVSLLEGRIEILPAHGRAIPWMCGVVRAVARRHRTALEMAWAIDLDP
jgi:DNA-directed RNA polymerase specialized sigma24 family protein